MERIPKKNLTDKLLVSICENLPADMTISENFGFCRRDLPDCVYYEKKTTICKKKTYTPTQEFMYSFI